MLKSYFIISPILNQIHLHQISFNFYCDYSNGTYRNNLQNVTIKVIGVKYFGRLHLGSIRKVATVFIVPFGLSYDMTGSYSPVFLAMAVMHL